jgi:hypothetical protein
MISETSGLKGWQINSLASNPGSSQVDLQVFSGDSPVGYLAGEISSPHQPSSISELKK